MRGGKAISGSMLIGISLPFLQFFGGKGKEMLKMLHEPRKHSPELQVRKIVNGQGHIDYVSDWMLFSLKEEVCPVFCDNLDEPGDAKFQLKRGISLSDLLHIMATIAYNNTFDNS